MSPQEFSGALGSWRGLFPRCLDPLQPGYKHYGGRGITICDRWYDFRNFITDMGGRPEGTTLDRINNDGNYEPGNCRWATDKEQARNTRRNVRVVVDGVQMLATDAAKLLSVSEGTISRRVKAGKPCDLKRGIKLTPSQVRAIRASTDDAQTIAAQFGVSHQSVYSIIARRTWKGLVA